MREPKIVFVLYISAASPPSLKALRNMNTFLEQYPDSDISFEVRDLATDPLQDMEDDRITFTPTLVKRSPAPRTWIVGDLENTKFIADLVAYAGVEKKR
jgi:hypothetical protein